MPFRPGGTNGKTGQGIASSMKFSRSIGRLEGLLIGMGVNHHCVTPQKWMNALNCRTKGDKRVTRNLAIKLYPQLKPTHATADAILICRYGELQQKAKK